MLSAAANDVVISATVALFSKSVDDVVEVWRESPRIAGA